MQSVKVLYSGVKKVYNGHFQRKKSRTFLSQKSRKCVFLHHLKIAEMCINNYLKNLGKVNYETKNIQ